MDEKQRRFIDNDIIVRLVDNFEITSFPCASVGYSNVGH